MSYLYGARSNMCISFTFNKLLTTFEVAYHCKC